MNHFVCCLVVLLRGKYTWTLGCKYK